MAKHTIGNMPPNDSAAAIQVATDLIEAGVFSSDHARMIRQGLVFEQEVSAYDAFISQQPNSAVKPPPKSKRRA